MPRFLLMALLAAALQLLGVAASADSVSKQVELLRTSKDFRVRTQAALALGASNDERAVTPLCQALGDNSRTVRIASATAIGRLGRGGKGCLERRLQTEKVESVKATIRRALESLEGGGATPAIGDSTRIYLAIGDVSNGDRGQAQAQFTRSAMVRTSAGLNGYAVAPSKESPADAKRLLAKYSQAKAYYLAPKLYAPLYSGGNLSIKLSVAILSYPDKAMLGQFNVKLTQQDVVQPDPQAEKELIEMVAERAIQKFAAEAHRLGS